MEIDIPALERQNQIVEIINLHVRRQFLEKKRIEKQDLEMSAMLTNLVKGEK